MAGAIECVWVEGVETFHMSDISGNYATACGLDGNDNDPAVQQETKSRTRDGKIDCRTCLQIWRNAKQYRASDFDSKEASRG